MMVISLTTYLPNGILKKSFGYKKQYDNEHFVPAMGILPGIAIFLGLFAAPIVKI